MDSKNLRIYRFSKNRFYGGVITAFCGECNLDCLFCYSQNKRNTGSYLPPHTIGERLVTKAQKQNIELVRISGGDPFAKHMQLLKVIEYVVENSNVKMILETNGVVLGQDNRIVEELKQFPKGRIDVRVSVKHNIPHKYEILTKRPGKWALDSINAILKVKEAGINYSVSWMEDWFTPDELKEWKDFLRNNNIDPYYWDVEKFKRYRSVPYSKKEILNQLDE